MTVAIMIAVITLNVKTMKQEVDALAFKDMKTCNASIEAIKKEVLKTVPKVDLACVERPVY